MFLAGSSTDGHRPDAWPGNCGFTLIELLIVLAILAMVVTLVSPQLSRQLDRARLDSLTRELVTVLRETRNTAVTRSTVVAFVFDAEQRGYKTSRTDDLSTWPADIGLRLTRTDSFNRQLATREVRFFPGGGSSGAQLRVASIVGSYPIEIDWLTGKVIVGEFVVAKVK